MHTRKGWKDITELNGGYLWRIGWGMPGEEGGLLTHTILPVNFFYKYVLVYQYSISPQLTALD